MSAHGKVILLRLAKSILKQNSQVTTKYKDNRRFQLKGSIRFRTAAVRTAIRVIATIRLAQGVGRCWSVGQKELDLAVAVQRRLCADARLSARERAASLIRLAVIENYLPVTELGTAADDDHIRLLLSPQKPTYVPPPAGEIMSAEEATRRLNQIGEGA